MSCCQSVVALFTTAKFYDAAHQKCCSNVWHQEQNVKSIFHHKTVHISLCSYSLFSYIHKSPLHAHGQVFLFLCVHYAHTVVFSVSKGADSPLKCGNTKSWVRTWTVCLSWLWRASRCVSYPVCRRVCVQGQSRIRPVCDWTKVKFQSLSGFIHSVQQRCLYHNVKPLICTRNQQDSNEAF